MTNEAKIAQRVAKIQREIGQVQMLLAQSGYFQDALSMRQCNHLLTALAKKMEMMSAIRATARSRAKENVS